MLLIDVVMIADVVIFYLPSETNIEERPLYY
jgi:hypothetical protein